MIVSDQHRFIFMHIPKCAGTSVRRVLRPYDDTEGTYDARIVDHPDLGRIDLTHMPPDLLERVSPEIHAKLLRPDYASFAVLRDPYERFPSSVAQRIKMGRDEEMGRLATSDLHAEIDAAIAHVSAHPAEIDPTYIHFRRQGDFIHQDGRQVVDRLFTLEGLPVMMDEIAARTGEELRPLKRANRTETLRVPALRRPVRAASWLVKSALPHRTARRIRTKARRTLLQDLRGHVPEAFTSETVRAFIAAHYADDIALHARVASPAAEGIPA